MNKDSKNKKRRKRRHHRFASNNMAITEEPKAPVFDDDASEKTEEEIHEQIKEQKNSGWGKSAGSFFSGNGGLVLPVAVLAVAVGISFFALDYLETDEDKDKDKEVTPVVTTSPEPAPPPIPVEPPEEPMPEPPEPEPIPEPPKEPEPVTVEAKETFTFSGPAIDEGEMKPEFPQPATPTGTEIPILRRTLTGINVSATPGDGITHLARRAIDNQLTETEQSLIPEQKVYAEDDLQNKTGTYLLRLGQQIEFPYKRVDNSISASQELKQWEIKNLGQYTIYVYKR